MIASSVSSGNRNFEGRINPYSKANYLASPPLVVAYALAGTVDIDLANDAIGTSAAGDPVYLKDIWPTQQEITDMLATAIQPEMFVEQYGNVFDGNETWNALNSGASRFVEKPFDVDELAEIVSELAARQRALRMA